VEFGLSTVDAVADLVHSVVERQQFLRSQLDHCGASLHVNELQLALLRLTEPGRFT
jgi:hypothetical protein